MLCILPSIFTYDQTPASYISFALRLMTDVLVWKKRTVICCPYAQTTRRHVGECKVQKYRTFKHWIFFALLFVSVVFGRVRKNCERRLLDSSCLSFSSHGTTRLPLDGFFMKFDVWVFCETLLRNPSFIKI